MSILVIEDDRSIRQLVEETLRDEGFDVEGVADAAVALERLDLAPRPQLLVLDKRLPGLDGYEFLERYLEREAHPVPVILLTASVEPETLPSGVSAYLQKPFDLDDLVVLVRLWIGEH